MARRKLPMQRLRMIGTIAGIASTIIVIVRVHRSSSSMADKIKRGEPGGSPLLSFYCVVYEAR
jgi:hypothetical protein